MAKKNKQEHQHNGLLLTGGGARAAYQVGVLSAIGQFLPRNHSVPFPIISGTSAGAINATALACFASCFRLGIKKLEWVWKNFSTEQVYHSSYRHVFGDMVTNFLSRYQADYANKPATSLLNNAPLRDLLNHVLDFERLESNINRGYLSSIAITASSYTSGDSITFFQGQDSIKPWTRAKRRGQPTMINTDHLLASAAIPLVFPAVRINHEQFGDGTIHQLSPLSPSIHMGARKIFIIGLEQPKEPIYRHENIIRPPNFATVAGHLLDTVFTDTLKSDIERMERVNNTLDLISPEHQEQYHLNRVTSMVINPTHDFNAIAYKYYQDMPIAVRQLLRMAGINENSQSSLLSYLLFEKRYCRQLIKLGYEDALEQEQAIRAFLSI